MVLCNIPLIELFKEEFEQAIVDFDSKQRHTNRRIGSYKNYYTEQKNNAQEMILQVGNEREQLTEEQYWEFFRRAYEQFRLQNPTLKVFHASIHFDETTPHMHLDFIPVAESSRGLTKKVSMEGALKPLGFERIKGEKYSETPYKRWLADRRRTYEALAGEYTKIEPSDIAAEKHQEPQEYKAKIKQEIEINGLIATLKSNNPIAISQAAHKIVSNAEKVMEMYAERGKKLKSEAQKDIKKEKLSLAKQQQELEKNEQKLRLISMHQQAEQQRLEQLKNSLERHIQERTSALETELATEKQAHERTQKMLVNAQETMRMDKAEIKLLYAENEQLRGAKKQRELER